MFSLDAPALVFLQLALVLAAVRIVGAAASRLGQPQVVGEMIAGVILGPSIFGLWWPDLQATLFPPDSTAVLHALSQIGLVLYMFLVGTEFHVDWLRQRLRSAASVSVAGIAAPFLLGGLVAVAIHGNPALFPRDVSIGVAVLFMGAAMSITAFPVLARIIAERGLTGTPLGTLVLAAGALNDAAAWCVFAAVLAFSIGAPAMALVTIGSVVVYIGVATALKGTLLAWLGARAEQSQGVRGPMLSGVLLLLMLGAWFTESAGIHAVFGAFVLGAVMPRGTLTRDLQRHLGPITTYFLVPLFFAYSGLRTHLGLALSGDLWSITVVVFLAACLGKGGACWLAARLNGERNREAMAIGTLMNARGLMELILLNIALERGIITPGLFSAMVIMAIGTTLMATPVFDLIYRGAPPPPGQDAGGGRDTTVPSVARELQPPRRQTG